MDTKIERKKPGLFIYRVRYKDGAVNNGLFNWVKLNRVSVVKIRKYGITFY